MRVRSIYRFLAAAGLTTLACGTARAQFTVNVSGDLDWRDGQNNLHDARGVKVELYSKTVSGTITKEATVNADMDGHYSTSFSSFAPGFLTCWLQVYAENSAGFAGSGTTGALLSPDPATTYGIQTPTFGVGAGNNFINADFSNAIDAGRAFGVLDMMLVGAQFANDARGAALAPLAARFPHSPPPAPNTSFYSAARNGIYILSDDRWDPDVVGHEYSHYLHRADNMTDSPGGTHSLGVSNIPNTATKVNGKKSAGIRLAWGEGVGNYMGVAMQHVNPVTNKYPTGYQNFGDTSYTDTLDSTNNFNLETTAGSGMQGEGEEVAITRILWDIADPKNEAHDHISRGHVQVYKDLVAARDRVRTQTGDNTAKLATLNQVNDYYMTDVAANDKDRVDYGAIYEQYTVSPHPIGGLIGSTKNPFIENITFDWTRQNNNMSDTFRLIVWNDNFTTRLINSFLIPGDVTTYTLTAAQEAMLMPGLGQTLNFSILGADLRDTNGDAYTGLESTSNYWSDAYQFTLVPEPASVVLLASAGVFALRPRRARP